ncbi:hypothetical protein GCM10009753_57830 [Streptantibioticus ferralitis]
MVVTLPAVGAVGALAARMAQGVIAASFAVSGTGFQVSSGKLISKGLAGFVQTDHSTDGKGHPPPGRYPRPCPVPHRSRPATRALRRRTRRLW